MEIRNSKISAALPSGSNTIGNVGINAGTNVIGTVKNQDGSGNALVAAAPADAYSNATLGVVGNARLMLYNGASWDMQRANLDAISIQASTAKTASFNTANQTNYNHRGAIFTIAVTAVSGTTPTLAVMLADKNNTGFTTLSTNITATGTYKYIVYPAGGFTNTSASVVGTASIPLPRLYNLYFSIGGTTPSFTFSVTVDYIL